MMKLRLDTFAGCLHDKIFLGYKDELRKATMDCKSLLDVGCGKNSPVQYLSEDLHSEGVDIFSPAIETSRKRNIHDAYHEINVLEIDKHFKKNSFDCVLASDLIEHLTKDDGLKLIEMMERIAIKKVIIFTPRGFVPQDKHEGNIWQVHKSGWEVEEMISRGYEVIGINGWKKIWVNKWLWRKMEDANVLVRMVRKLLIDVTQLYTKQKPEYAFQIMCIKSKENE